ncbi:hypothetical protein RND81_02G097800 [Saponaria officinalis]|uniref:Uncharacterized protein n=1 Tax=Saponaria officinalis TaxID=3572 RepID=A0AAW1MKL3_SAPOF
MIWSGPWIPRTQTRRVVSPHGGSRTDMRVAELNAPDGVSWNVPPVQSIFLPFEQDRILSIFLSHNKPDDTWCWDPEKDGIYSLKSAYRLPTDDTTNTEGQSDFSREQWLWNKISSTPVLVRIKLFFRQLCNEALAT